jgi:1-acyl-sn-glycerol-3-phosphate acyltransferase
VTFAGYAAAPSGLAEASRSLIFGPSAQGHDRLPGIPAGADRRHAHLPGHRAAGGSENPEAGILNALTVFRSLLFNGVFYLNLVAFLVLGAWFFFTPRAWSMAALKVWSRASQWWLEAIAGTRMEVRGREHLPAGAALVAGKHQSMWETFALFPLFDDPAIVLKRELMWIPLLGWFAWKFGMIPVDRTARGPALKSLCAAPKPPSPPTGRSSSSPKARAGRPMQPPDYKSGATALYLKLKVPCVPFALNSGLFWPRRKLLRRPGTIVVEFLPAIPPGLPRKEFERRLVEAIEPATARLLAEGRREIEGTPA